MLKQIKHYFDENQKKTIVIVAIGGFLLFNLIFFFIPLGYGIIGSFCDWNPLTNTMVFTNIQNYIQIFNSKLFKISLKNTIIFSGSLVILRTFLGLIIAAGIHSLKKHAGVLRSLYFLPVIMPIVAISLVWKWIYNPRVGLLNMLLAAFGFVGKNWLMDKSLAMPAVIAMTAWKDVGYAVIIFIASLMNIPNSYYEAASIDGANGIQKFKSITLPCLRPTTIFIVITSLISYFQSFVQIFIMTDGGPGTSTYVLSYMIYHEAFVNYRFGFASALSIVLFFIILIITFIQLKVLPKGDEA
jgi:multiple sugar transport system permease protein